MLEPPAGIEALAGPDRSLVWVRAGLAGAFEGRELLPATGPPPDAVDPRPLPGRGGAFAVDWPGLDDRLVFRRLLHGGMLRGLTGDRFVGRQPRPLLEVRTSAALRAAGVATPEVVFAVVRPLLGSAAAAAGGAWPAPYRGAVATRWVDGARDLASVLEASGGQGSPDDPGVVALLRAAGALVRRMHDAGVVHADLNLRNLLVVGPDTGAGGGAAAELLVIDLDRSRVQPDPGPGPRQGNLDRMLRSLRRFPGATRVVGPVARAALREGYEGEAPLLGPA